ncbi:aminotransferase class III-fold pyridoxal phosphate-dependent enzyme [Halobacillus rhizosphaerae]|uniref:aminotransferase class III-fold pyridoxal phosphate-dependent enzyme n=1 Tax=Halobacillus rhizosphaerae TaxID=3064889 RepID=UPI00398B82A8
MSHRYFKSEELLERALKSIPLGSQTYSKSYTHYPFGASPYFIKKGQGSRVWDADNNEYIDFVNSLLAILLGYNDPDVKSAVKEQLELGTIFSLPHELEIKVAEKIIQMVPCAEKVRFGKNGSDATSGAIRLARAYTGRDRVAVCGYHGWHDWYIGSTTRDLGIPEATKQLTHTFTYNNLDSLEILFRKYPNQISAVILEPMNIEFPKDGFLKKLKKLVHEHGALLVFDETITGFRFAKGGAQEYFNVIPDLATFGKGMANGYPISVITGRTDIMQLSEEAFLSFTFGGETLSLAATLATLDKITKEPVIDRIKESGKKIMSETERIITEHSLEDLFEIKGHPSWSFLVIKSFNNYSTWEIKTLFLQEMFKRGILTVGTHNLSYSHSDQDIKKLIDAYEEVLPLIKAAVVNNKLDQLLTCKPLQPLFKVR